MYFRSKIDSSSIWNWRRPDNWREAIQGVQWQRRRFCKGRELRDRHSCFQLVLCLPDPTVCVWALLSSGPWRWPPLLLPLLLLPQRHPPFLFLSLTSLHFVPLSPIRRFQALWSEECGSRALISMRLTTHALQGRILVIFPANVLVCNLFSWQLCVNEYN